MQKFLDLSKYKITIIGIYIILFPLFFIFAPNTLRYSFSTENFSQISLIILTTFLAFYVLNLLFNFRKMYWQNLRLSQIVWITIYALLFAIPEEIIFRGIIQGTLHHYINSVFFVVIISSAIFGLAHLPNGGKGWHPKNWNWNLATITFLAGLPLSLIFALTNSLLIPTLLHAFFLIFYKLLTNRSSELEKI